MKKLTILIIISFLFVINSFGQKETLSEKDSLMKFLVRGLWIQLEIEKNWNQNTDTLITYTELERKLYYRNELMIMDFDTLYSEVDKYSTKTIEFFEDRTSLKREVIHKHYMIEVLSKELILSWVNWFEENSSNIDISEIKNIMVCEFQESDNYLFSRSDTSFKNGEFLKYIETDNDSSTLRIKGQYVENVKKGIWVWYDNLGEVDRIYDYDKGRYLKGNHYIQANIKYPEEAIENGIQGIVTIEYSVDCDCNVTINKTINSIGFGCDEEAIRNISYTYLKTKEAGYPCNKKTDTKSISFNIK